MNTLILKLGVDMLNEIGHEGPHLNEIVTELNTLADTLDSTEDIQSWFCCVLALRAASKGNFGVGAAVFDETDNLLSYASNEVFVPRFRSDGHAEMLALDSLESKHADRLNLSKCKLITSLESCPMCASRILVAQVGTVVHVADDDIGGMARFVKDLPSAWKYLADSVTFRRARCIDALHILANSIFLSTVTELNRMLKGE